MITLDCPACGRTLNVPTEAAGRMGRCTRCKATFTIPFPDDVEILPPPAMPLKAEQPEERVGSDPRIIARSTRMDRPKRREVAHRTRGSFGTAFGLSTGCLLFSLYVLVVLKFFFWVC
jgi:hypothetical protein